MTDETRLTRRSSLKGLGLIGAAAWFGGAAGSGSANAAEAESRQDDSRRRIFAKVLETPLVDTHEHLCEEKDRLNGQGADDWSLVFSGYLGSDLIAAGMPRDVHGKFGSKGPSPAEKWKLLAPYWPGVKNTGYGQAARISIRELYGVDDLSAETVEKIQEGYATLRRPMIRTCTYPLSALAMLRLGYGDTRLVGDWGRLGGKRLAGSLDTGWG